MSLRRRLNRGLIIILTAVFTANWLAADWVIRWVAEREMLTRLTHDGDSLLDSLQQTDTGQLKFDISHAGSVYGQSFSGHYFVIHLDDRVLYSPSLSGETLPFEPLPDSEVRVFHYSDGPGTQPLLVLSRGVERFGHHISLSLAEDLTAIGHDISGVRVTYSFFCLIVLFIAISLQSADVKRSLAGFKTLKEELAAIAEGKQRQVEVVVPSEVKPLVSELNRLLVLVDRRLHVSRTALGNLAHALKTPLAMLFRLTESDELQAYPELREQFQRQNEVIHERVARELKRARISGNYYCVAAFNPHQELTALLQLLSNIYSQKSLHFSLSAPDRMLACDREDMLEVMGNLLDNACKWTAGRVDVQFTCEDGMAIQISDDGPGCSEQLMQDLVNRGVRLDESVEGHGLGLGIVRDIIEFYGGTLQLANSEKLGGLQVNVWLPKV